MIALAAPAAGLVSDALSQVMSGFANRASAAAKGFDADLQSDNVGGAQSFLSALQQKLTAQGNAPAGSAVAAQFSQISNDLSTGNLAAAKADFSSLQQSISHLKHGSSAEASGSGTGDPGQALASAAAYDPRLASLQSYNPVHQAAFSGALSLSLPSGMPSLSVNS